MNSDNQLVIYCEDDGEYNPRIHTNLCEFLLEYTFNYSSSYTTMIVQFYEYL